MNLYGLIGYPLSHSFSEGYFTDKFDKEQITNSAYKTFEIESIEQFKTLFKKYPGLRGLNVTIPYKESVIPFLDKLDSSAEKVGAVNVIKVDDNELIGFNSDYFGFKSSLSKIIDKKTESNALVLGTGGASKAVTAVLRDLKVGYFSVSRVKSENAISYDEARMSELLRTHHLVINTTPLGMSPNTNEYPDIDYSQIRDEHICFDLIYNPEKTQFLSKAEAQGATICNGLEMLHLQAEKSWEIWNA